MIQVIFKDTKTNQEIKIFGRDTTILEPSISTGDKVNIDGVSYKVVDKWHLYETKCKSRPDLTVEVWLKGV